MMPNDSSLYTATTAGLAALKTSIYSTARMLEALIASNAITREVAIAIVDDMERDVRYTITGAPELGPVIDLHYQTARKALCVVQGD
jgi:hypothetical protein